jgi:hypothetical protein
MNIIEIYSLLLHASERIGNTASVGFELMRANDVSNALLFRVDWDEENYHFRFTFSETRLLAQPDDIVDILVYQAQRAYNNEQAKERATLAQQREVNK